MWGLLWCLREQARRQVLSSSLPVRRFLHPRPCPLPEAPQAASLTRASCINNSPALLRPVWVAQGEDQ